jgi:hypothetical protein
MATAAELNLFNQLMATGDYAGAAQVAQQAGYNPADVASYINQNLAGLNLPTDANISADLVQSLYTPAPASTTSPDALLQGFNNAMASGDFNAASNVVSQATQIYGPETAANLTNYLGLPPGFAATGFTPAALQSISSTFVPDRPAIQPTTTDSRPIVDQLTSAGGESQIDPVIAPYLSEALGRARSLFLTGAQPELYPGQMFVGPSDQTLSALSGMETIAGAAQPFYEQAATGVMSGLKGLESTASGSFLGGATFKNAAGEDVNYRDALISAATRPLTQQFTEEVMPGIQSTFSRAGRLGSGAQGAVTGRATEGFTRALGDVTSRIAAEDYARERGFQEAATRDVLLGAGRLGDITSSFLAPSSVLADVGARREAIAGQPLAESMRRFEYTQNLPQDQFAKYMASIYGSPLGTNTAAPTTSGNPFLSDLGAVLNVAGSIPNAVTGLQTGYAGLKSAGTTAANFLGGLIK